MKLPRQELLEDSQNPEGLEKILIQAEKVLNTWESSWSPFIAAPLREEALQKIASLAEVNCFADGGYPGAERQRIRIERSEKKTSPLDNPAPLKGIRVKGNFLFDKASPRDFRNSLETIGASIDELGDLWVYGDRGAQAICSPEGARFLHGKLGLIRDVQITCEEIDKRDLHLPKQRIERQFTTIEASLRLDAIASAGFGISRAKILKYLESGTLRLNWNPVSKSSKELVAGDQLQLEGRGMIQVISLGITKKHRWRVDMLLK